MIDHQRVLFTNDAFYLAFTNRDFPAMERLWSRASPVVCIHPGWPALVERAAIMESWKNILENPDTPAIAPHHARLFMHGGLACVVCYEEIGGSMLVATNLFVEERGELCLVHHQAAPCANPPVPEEKAKPNVQ